MNEIIEAHYRAHKNKYLKRISKRCGDYAEDCVQTAYMRCILYSDSFHRGMNFDTWFKRILFTTVSDYRKFANGQAIVDIDENEVDPVEELGFPNALRLEIWKDIDALRNDVEREVVSLHFKYGYKHSEIVHLTDASSRNVHSWLSKFRSFVKDKYK